MPTALLQKIKQKQNEQIEKKSPPDISTFKNLFNLCHILSPSNCHISHCDTSPSSDCQYHHWIVSSLFSTELEKDFCCWFFFLQISNTSSFILPFRALKTMTSFFLKSFGSLKEILEWTAAPTAVTLRC